MSRLATNLKAVFAALWDDTPAPERGLMPPGGEIRDRRRAGRWIGLAAVLILGVGLALDLPTPSFHGEGLIALIGLTGIALIFFVEFRFNPQSVRWVTLFALSLSFCSTLIAIVQPGGTAVVGTYVAVGIAARRLPRLNALVVAVPSVIFVDAVIALSAPDRVFTLLWATIGFVFTFMISRYARIGQQQREDAMALIEEEKRSMEARTEAAALAERGRIAREMHDVLAHSLSALAVELEGARLLARSHGTDPAVEAAIERAHSHATVGIDEARAAIEALRGDDLPGPERLATMAERFAEEQDIECEFEVSGEARSLASEASLTIYRTAQEALTNVRKHADPERVELRLDYAKDGTRLEVADHGDRSRHPIDSGTLGESGAGYGVSGMRERAELLGGRLRAGPTEDGFRVELWLPEEAPA